MRLPLILLPALALLLGVRPPDRLGLGIVTVEVADGVRLDLFETPDSSTPLATIEIEEDPANLTFAFSATSPDWLRPEALSLDYSLFAFRAVAATGAAYEIIVNEESGRTLWLRRQSSVEFKPWEQYLVENVTGFSRVTPESNPIRISPDEAAPVVPYSASEEHGWGCLAVAEVEGEWVRIRLSDLCTSENARPVNGWVRWRGGDQLLIDYGLTC